MGFTVKCSLPACYEGDGANVVFGEAARHISVEELKKGCIIDICAARIFKARGIDVGLLDEKLLADIKKQDLGVLSTPIHVRYLKEERIIKLTGDAGNVIPTVSDGAEVLTAWECENQQFDAIYRYENVEGMRFIVLPMVAQRADQCREYFDCYCMRRLILDHMAWLNGKPLDAYTLGDHPGLYSIVKKDDSSMAIGLWNLFDDRIKRAEVKVNFDYKNARFINCQGHAEEGKIVLDSTLYPYEFVAIVLEK